MRRAVRHIIFILCITLSLAGCDNTKRNKANCQQKSYRFVAPLPPMQVAEEQQRAFMQEHYWDKFDFTDSLYTTKADTTEMIQAYGNYIAHFVGPTNQEPVRRLMRKASTSKAMFEYFVMLSEKVLHDANSPLRSDELYIAVLEAQITSPYYDKYERMAPEYDLHIATQNRIGHKANNFEYRLASGESKSLYSLKCNYTILYINNPGCAMCRNITRAITESSLITELQRRGVLKILAIYPDRDIPAWREHLVEYPAEWINGYDYDLRIERERLYDLKAIPALYLLDRDKRVLVKDSTDIAELEYAISVEQSRK